MTQAMSQGTIEAMLHTGNAIWFIAQLYSDPTDAVVEMVQNALDKHATKILIEIHKERPARVAAYDNGDGASIEEIQQKFANICRSFKGDDPDAIGEKGIGNLAGIAIGEEYYLITRPKRSRKPYFRISLKREEVIDKANVHIPWEEIGPTANLPRGYYTLIMLKRVDAGVANTLSDLDALAGAIAAAFSEQIRRRNIDVILERYVRGGCAERKKVEPQEFPGQKQEPIEIATKFGPVIFDFYATIVAQKRPKVLVDHKGKYSFLLSAQKMRFMPSICQTVFDSGYLQGYIRVPFGTLRGDRKDLERDEEREVFIQALEIFSQKHGLPYIEELRKGEKLDSYERIVEAALEPLGRYFKDYPDKLPNIFQGLVSSGHTDAERGSLVSTSFLKLTKKTRTPPPIRSPKKKETQKERRMVHINVQQTKQGRPRRQFPKRQQQPGLTVVLEEGNIATGLKWRSRVADGKIHINISHRDWGLITDRGKTVSIDYVKFLILKEISRAALGGVQGKFFHENFEVVLMPYFVGAVTTAK